MAPEQAMGKNVDVSVATEIYGVGAILYAMLAGKAPFGGNTSMDVLRKVVQSNPRKLDSSVVSQDLRVICEKCLEKEPGDRYLAANELANDLQRFLSGEPIIARPPGKLSSVRRWARRNPAIAAFGFVASAMLLFALVSLSFLLRSESMARRAAESGGHRERTLNAAIQGTLASENAARRRAELNLNDAYASYAYAAQQQDRPNEAFLWFCKAARESPDERLKDNRNRVAAWMQRIPRPVFASHQKGMRLAEFDSSNNWLLCFQEDQAAFLVFDLRSGTQVHVEIENSPTCVTWGSQPGILWIGDSMGSVLKLSCETGELDLVAQIPAAVSCLNESSDGSLLAIGYDDRVAICESRNQSSLEHSAPFPASVQAVQFCCQDRRLLATCDDQLAYLKSINNLKKGNPDKEVLSFPFLLRNRTGMIGSENKQPFPPMVYQDHKLALLQNADTDDTNPLQLKTFDLNDGRLLDSCDLGTSYCNSVPNHLGEIVTGGDQQARILTTQGEIHSEKILHGHRVTRCCNSPDGQMVATAGWQTVRLTERTESREMFRWGNDVKPAFAILPHQIRVSDISFSGDGRQLATVQFDGLIRVWEIANARPPKIDIPVEQSGNQAVFADGPFRCLFTGNHHRSGNVRNFRGIAATEYRKLPHPFPDIHVTTESLPGHLTEIRFCKLVIARHRVFVSSTPTSTANDVQCSRTTEY